MNLNVFVSEGQGTECIYRDVELWEIGAMTNNSNPLERERVVTSDRESRHILKWQNVQMEIISSIIFVRIICRIPSVFAN